MMLIWVLDLYILLNLLCEGSMYELQAKMFPANISSSPFNITFLLHVFGYKHLIIMLMKELILFKITLILQLFSTSN